MSKNGGPTYYLECNKDSNIKLFIGLVMETNLKQNLDYIKQNQLYQMILSKI